MALRPSKDLIVTACLAIAISLILAGVLRWLLLLGLVSDLGERFARVRDPFGHEWGIATQLTEMSSEEIESAAKRIFSEMSE